MLAGAKNITPHRMMWGNTWERRTGMGGILDIYETTILDYRNAFQPVAVVASDPNADAVCAGLLDNGAQRVLQQLVRIGLLGHRVQGMSQRVQLAARKVFRRVQRLRRFLALSNVPQDDGENQFAAEIELGNGCLSRKIAAVFSSAKDFAPLSHGARNIGRFCERFDVPTVRVRKTLRQEDVERLANDFGLGISKDLFRTLVEQNDALF
jgi:hypothetical protein